MGPFSALARWFERRRAFRALCREEARNLLELNPHTAYYDAQRIAARARFAGDSQAFIHWARVAAEIARISNNPMDRKIVEQIVDEEARRSRRDGARK